MASELEKMLRGELYRPGDPELVAIRRRAQELTRAYNATVLGEDSPRSEILAELLGSHGAGTAIRVPFSVDYGRHIHLGRDVFINNGCTFLDVCEIRVGDGTQIGPNSQLLAADHPRDPEARRAGYENGKPVSVGRNCWLGAGVLILPGVTVGDDAIVGAGSVVTRDVPAGATVAGNPARIIGGH